mgnify:CR=1 FL=1
MYALKSNCTFRRKARQHAFQRPGFENFRLRSSEDH